MDCSAPERKGLDKRGSQTLDDLLKLPSIRGDPMPLHAEGLIWDQVDEIAEGRRENIPGGTDCKLWTASLMLLERKTQARRGGIPYM